MKAESKPEIPMAQGVGGCHITKDSQKLSKKGS
jgi:hypothetical protein